MNTFQEKRAMLTIKIEQMGFSEDTACRITCFLETEEQVNQMNKYIDNLLRNNSKPTEQDLTNIMGNIVILAGINSTDPKEREKFQEAYETIKNQIPLEDRPEYSKYPAIRNIIIGAKKRRPNISDEKLEEEMKAFGIL